MSNRKKIFFTTVHSAPYIDLWLEELAPHYDLCVLYRLKRSPRKPWADVHGFPGAYYETTSWRWIFGMVRRSDFVFLGGINYVMALVVFAAAFLFRKKVAVQSDYPREQKKDLRRFLKKCFLRLFADYFFGATPDTCKKLREYFGGSAERYKIVPYAHKYQPVPELINEERRIALRGGDRICLFIANNFYPRKGYGVVLEAFKTLKALDLLKEFRIMIAGTGEEFVYYAKQFGELASDIEVLGWIEDVEYTRLMRSTDVYLHASCHEPFGIPPLDTMSMGKLLIVSDGVKSTSGLIEHGKNGLHYPAEDADALVCALRQVTENRDSIYEIGRQAVKTVSEHFHKGMVREAVDTCF